MKAQLFTLLLVDARLLALEQPAHVLRQDSSAIPRGMRFHEMLSRAAINAISLLIGTRGAALQHYPCLVHTVDRAVDTGMPRSPVRVFTAARFNELRRASGSLFYFS